MLAEDGDVVVFELNRATARFVAVGAHAGALLLFGAAYQDVRGLTRATRVGPHGSGRVA